MIAKFTNEELFKKQLIHNTVIYSRYHSKMKEEVMWNFPDHISHGNFIVRPINGTNNASLIDEGIYLFIEL